MARGFEDTDLQKNDSLTCSKECLRLMFTLLPSIDIKAAFLHGKGIERDVFINSQEEIRENII